MGRRPLHGVTVLEVSSGSTAFNTSKLYVSFVREIANKVVVAKTKGGSQSAKPATETQALRGTE